MIYLTKQRVSELAKSILNLEKLAKFTSNPLLQQKEGKSANQSSTFLRKLRHHKRQQNPAGGAHFVVKLPTHVTPVKMQRGSEAELKVVIGGKPLPKTVTWWRDGKKIETGAKFR